MEESVREVIAGGARIFAGTLIASLTGLLFWFVVTKFSGVATIGEASTVISTAQMATTLISAGLGIAALREAAAKRGAAVAPVLTLASVLGLVSAVVSGVLLTFIGWARFVPIVSLIALVSVVSMAAVFLLAGLERFSGFLFAQLAGSLAKLIVGSSLAYLGLAVWAVFAGFLAYPVLVIVSSLALLFPYLVGGLAVRGSVAGVLSVALANHPFMVSNQLVVPLSVYLYSAVTGEMPATGVLYISLMIMVSVANIAVSLINASLPIGMRTSTNPTGDALTIGLGLSAPAVAAGVVASDWVLSLINPGMVPWADVLRVLLLAIVPYSVVTAAIIRLNREGAMKEVLLIGGARLAILLVTVPPLIKYAGVSGAAAAFLLSNAALTPYAARWVSITPRGIAAVWLPQAASLILAAQYPTLPAALAAAAASLAIIHLAGVLRLGDIPKIISVALT